MHAILPQQITLRIEVTMIRKQQGRTIAVAFRCYILYLISTRIYITINKPSGPSYNVAR